MLSPFQAGHAGRLSAALVLAAAMLPAHARNLAPIDALMAAPVPAAQRKAAQALPEQVLSLSREERLGVPTFVHLRPALNAAKAGPAPRSAAEAARAALRALADLYGMTPQEVDAAPVHHEQALRGGSRLVRLTNRRDGIEVFREQATVLLDAQGRGTAIGGYLGGTALADRGMRPASRSSGAAAAVARALQDWGFKADVARQLGMARPARPGGAGAYQWWALAEGVAGEQGATLQQPARVKPVWFRLPQGLVKAHYVELLLREEGGEHAWAYVVADDDGSLLLRHNQTAHQAHAHEYRVFADPATGTPWPGPQARHGTPHPTGLPDGYAPPLEGANLVRPPVRIADPWLAANATQTSGNNVYAYADLTAPDGWNAGDPIAQTTAPGVFDHVYNHALPTRADNTQISASVVNLFYVTNWLHDWFYGAGFNEAAGNAQASNFGRGGLDGDAMRAEALDWSGTNNANMSTPADGAPPRMQMYRFVNASPVTVSLLAPASLARAYTAGKAAFGPQVYDVTAEVVAAQSASGSELCGAAVAPLTGKIALVNRGGCNFTDKAMYAQQAGAVGMVVADNLPGPVTGMGASGTPVDAQITIPAVRISQADGAAWRDRLTAGDTLNLHLRAQSATVERSSALDNTIVAHEWGHYISNRLIGDSSGLTTNHAKGLGEGWGDFHALLMMVTEADRDQPGNNQYQGAYATGAYATEGAVAPARNGENRALRGIRRYPYSTDMSKNPLTFKHIQNNTSLPTTPEAGSGVDANNAQVHNTGEVWASMLWECYASLLNANAFSDAQALMTRSLVAGYKLTPINPLMTEARDALLAAMAAESPSNARLCAAAFAKRGAGTDAQPPDRNSTTNNGVTEDFDMGEKLVFDAMTLSMTASGAQRCDADDVLDSGETGVLRITLRNQGGGASPGSVVQLSHTIAGLTLPDGPTITVPPIAGLDRAEVTARVRLDGMSAPGWGRITAQLAGGLQHTVDMPLHMDVQPASLASDDVEAPASAMSFGSTLTAFTDAWRVRMDAATLNHVYAGSPPAATGSHWMRTPPLHVATTGNFTVAFDHRHRFERDANFAYDGGQLMISTDDGANWVRVDGAGYNGTLTNISGNPAGNQSAYVGQSAGWPAMQATTVNLGAAHAGQTVRLAWVMHTDPAVTTEGWEVDNIVIGGITNTPFPLRVTDAQTCAGGAGAFASVTGGAQTATVDTPFAEPLRVRLLDTAGAPIAGELIHFTVPATGASAVLSAPSAITDVDGWASVTATANGTAGGPYAVTATGGLRSASFALTNTASGTGPEVRMTPVPSLAPLALALLAAGMALLGRRRWRSRS